MDIKDPKMLQNRLDEWAREAEEQYDRSPHDRECFQLDEFVRLYQGARLKEWEMTYIQQEQQR